MGAKTDKGRALGIKTILICSDSSGAGASYAPRIALGELRLILVLISSLIL